MRALLDVNVLIALLDAAHAFHQRAHEWWAKNSSRGWAGCPLVENGVVRIMVNPGYSATRRFHAEEIVNALSGFVGATDHEFWPDSLTLRDSKSFAPDRIHGGRQLTDLYLLALASRHGGRLATFDQGIPLSSVRTAKPSNLVVL
ncbi:MAG: TA system VapC family ribonuclease toxin [Terrimicrobiaceae bacterium]|nr:PIN domain-containing protein [Terrimicrobiaceae bacterium]